jgi:hypothetical protein
MITINITEETETKDNMVYVLELISKQISNGNTSGVNPSWEIEGEEEAE